MKIAIFDGFSGAGGDMIVASLLGVSLSENDLSEIVSTLSLRVSVSVEETVISGIVAKRVVVSGEEKDREFSEVIEIIESSNLDAEVKKEAKAIFERLARAEGVVHGRDYKKAVFHEVGSDDAIFDVVSAVTGLIRLRRQGYRFFATPIRLGSGHVEISHGKIPVPAPATLEILKNSKLEVVFGGEGELLTPTAAAILSHFCEGTLKLPFTVRSVSYSAGKRSLLRLILGECHSHDSIAILETTVDDASGELLGHAIEQISKLALDVNAVQVIGKKGRPAVLIRAITKLEKSEELSKLIMEETGSIGVRIIPVYHRLVAERKEEIREVEIDGKKFKVRVKISYPGVAVVKPEFEDVKAIASELKKPLPVVYREVMKNI
ncbi:nickel pincer cofactor biosynthesis protein LarC [Archaeoglobus veneficus]|uniref:Nickel pincer cofactor biosynthesis protein LarC n=1 Tax=Archaeoglobus veneficus (strain DSM 11195 / SNP6) TaxID=693661 RepID=F2KSM2_ARCVS|nr:nickel pincer cofactor biosynthesis protein LarC [Archaeoglobus veneficus]AEA48092.1 protein of unknown function DUF111 [Archaeoglobus veneficus SNP6]